MQNRIIAPALAALACGLATQAQAGRVFFVDAERGSDAATGMSPDAAWRRAPGDPLATGVAAKARLAAGDTIRFRGGVRYRGTVWVRAQGLPGNPVVYDGSGWGPTRAVMDGSDALPAAVPCASAADCLGSPFWRNLVRVAVPATARWHNWVFGDDQPLTLAQYPPVSSPLRHDEVGSYAVVPRERVPLMREGQVVPAAALPAGLHLGAPVLALWNSGNDVDWRESPVFGEQGIRFTVDGFVPPANRDGRFAVMNAPAMVNGPGKYAMSPKDGIAIIWPTRSGQRFAIGAHRTAFRVSTANHVAIRGFAFTNGSAPPGGYGVGGAVFGNTPMTGIDFSQNIIRSSVLLGGDGVVSLHRMSSSRISGNEMRMLPFASGVRTTQSPGPLEIECNRIADIGRTGIALLSVRDGTVRGNHLTGIGGIHANGITAYLDNRRITIADNIVTDALRPLTVHGDKGKPYWTDATAPDIRISGNTLVGIDPQEGAITSWGAGLANVTMTGNFLSAPRNAVRFMGTEANIVLDGNQLVGPPLTHNKAAILQGSNSVFAVAGNGAALVEAARQRTMPASVCGS